MLKYFDRYILKEIIPPFLIGLLVYAFVLLMNQIFLLSELLITKGVSFPVVARIFLYLIPSVLAFAVPMAVLMGILAGLSRLSSDSEVVALKTLGIGNTRLLWPVLLFALGGWLLTSFLTLYLAPRANSAWVQILTRSVLAKVQLKINPREFNESIPQTVIFIQDITTENNWKNVFVHFSRPGEEARAIFARSGRLNFFPDVKRATLELYDGTIHSVPLASPEKYSLTFFEKTEEEINVEGLFAQISSQKGVREKDIEELVSEVKRIKETRIDLNGERERLQKEGRAKNKVRLHEINLSLSRNERDWRSHWVEIHKKFALPFICFIFVLLGIPLGVSTRKGGRTSGFTISLGIILVYYILITAGEKLAMDGIISAFLGMWGPNIIFILLGAYLFLKSTRESHLFNFFSEFFGKKRPKKIRKRVRRETRLSRIISLNWRRPSVRFPNILDRYIIRKYLAIFILVFMGLLLISVIVTFFERMDNVYEHNKPLSLLFTYIQYRVPEFAHYILPVSALTTVLLSFGLLTKSNEIMAMKACGISLYRILVPAVVLAVLVSGFSFVLQERLLPYANMKAEEIWNSINDLPPRSYSYLNRRWVLSRGKNRIYNYNYYDSASHLFRRLSIYDLDLSSWSLKRRIQAEEAQLFANKLNLVDGWLRDLSKEGQMRYQEINQMELQPVEGHSYFVKEWREPALMNYRELKEYIAEIEEMGFETTRFKVDLKSKLSFPFVALIMTFLAIPFAFSMGKRGALVGIGLSIAIAIIYWGAIGIFKSLGYVNFLSAFLSSWGPNLIFGPVGLYLLFRLRT